MLIVDCKTSTELLLSFTEERLTNASAKESSTEYFIRSRTTPKAKATTKATDISPTTQTHSTFLLQTTFSFGKETNFLFFFLRRK